MAPLAVTGLVLGLTALSACSPIVARQETDAETAAEDTISKIPGLPVALPIKDIIEQAADANKLEKWVSIPLRRSEYAIQLTTLLYSVNQ